MIDPYRSNAAAKPAVIGIVLALIAMVLAFFPTGAGHGYSAPFFASMPLLLLFPMVLVRSRTVNHSRTRIGKDLAWDIGIVVFAVAANYYLIHDAIDFREGVGRMHDEFLVPGVHRSVFPMFATWLGLWLFWQWLAIRTLVRQIAGRALTGSRP